MTRQDYIEELIRHELEYLISNADRHTIEDVTEFFARGGFSDWSDESLEKQYNLFFKD